MVSSQEGDYSVGEIPDEIMELDQLKFLNLSQSFDWKDRREDRQLEALDLSPRKLI